MKVRLEDNYKDIYTISDFERAKLIISIAKDDGASVKEYALTMLSEALKDENDSVKEILKAEATTCRNNRVWNLYGDYDSSTYNMDIWINAVAETYCGFIKVGACLSDIWQIGADEVRQHMFIRRFKEV